MRVYDNMSFALELRGVSKAEIDIRVKRAAALLHIEPYLDRKPKELSGGQRQRVAMGRAIVRNPKAFLFDEPLSNLDAKLRGQVRAEIKALSQELKTTMVFVTHDQIEAMTWPIVLWFCRTAWCSNMTRRKRSMSGRRTNSSPASSARRR
jgi:multiple sugar transport system ATP-binding protein